MGGNAIKCSSPLTEEELKQSFKIVQLFLTNQYFIEYDDIRLIGSAFKKKPGELYGDVDVVVDISKTWPKSSIEGLRHFNSGITSQDYFYNLLISKFKRLGFEYKDMRQFGILSFGLPLGNNKYAQVDIMATTKIGWVEWSHYCPKWDQSEYPKGLYRNEILYALAKYDFWYIMERDETGLELTWKRGFFDLTKGLMRGEQTIKGKNKILKNAKTTEKWIISTDPECVVENLFNRLDISARKVLTWEQTLDLFCKEYKGHPKYVTMIAMIHEGIKAKGVPVPPILYELINEHIRERNEMPKL